MLSKTEHGFKLAVYQVHILGVTSCGTVTHICSGPIFMSHCSSVELVILRNVSCFVCA